MTIRESTGVSHTCDWQTGVHPPLIKACPACRRERASTNPGDLADRLEGLVRQDFREPDKYRTQIVLAAAERLRMYLVMEGEQK